MPAINKKLLKSRYEISYYPAEEIDVTVDPQTHTVLATDVPRAISKLLDHLGYTRGDIRIKEVKIVA